MQIYDEHTKPTTDLDKNVVLYLTTTWCGPCKKFGPLMEEIEKETPEVRFFRADTDLHPHLLEMYNITRIPSLLYFKPGFHPGKLSGSKTKEEVIEFLRSNA